MLAIEQEADQRRWGFFEGFCETRATEMWQEKDRATNASTGVCVRSLCYKNFAAWDFQPALHVEGPLVRVGCFVRMVGAAHERSRLDVNESEIERELFQLEEFIRMVVADHRGVSG